MHPVTLLVTSVFFVTGATTALAQLRDDLPTVAQANYVGPSTHLPTVTRANYVGPSGIPVMTVKQLLETGVDDQHATITGRLVRHTGGKHYDFADVSGEMKVEISPKHFPTNQRIDADTLVKLTGEFDKSHLGASEFEVEQIIVVSK